MYCKLRDSLKAVSYLCNLCTYEHPTCSQSKEARACIAQQGQCDLYGGPHGGGVSGGIQNIFQQSQHRIRVTMAELNKIPYERSALEICSRLWRCSEERPMNDLSHALPAHLTLNNPTTESAPPFQKRP
jgi:hypothetical protein